MYYTTCLHHNWTLRWGLVWTSRTWWSNLLAKTLRNQITWSCLRYLRRVYVDIWALVGQDLISGVRISNPTQQNAVRVITYSWRFFPASGTPVLIHQSYFDILGHAYKADRMYGHQIMSNYFRNSIRLMNVERCTTAISWSRVRSFADVTC